MNTTTNVGLQVIGTGLVALGFQTFSTDWITGSVAVVLGIIVYAVYEYFPTKTS